jgi:hypothetical protein
VLAAATPRGAILGLAHDGERCAPAMSALAGQEKRNEEDTSMEEAVSTDVTVQAFALASYSRLLRPSEALQWRAVESPVPSLRPRTAGSGPAHRVTVHRSCRHRGRWIRARGTHDDDDARN